MPPKPPLEFFAERPMGSDFAYPAKSHGLRRLILIAVMILVAAVIVFFVFLRGESTLPTPSGPPVLEAEGPYKERPENPGGLDVPNRDMTVFDRFDNAESSSPSESPPETLLPPLVGSTLPAPPSPPATVSTTVAPAVSTPAVAPHEPVSPGLAAPIVSEPSTRTVVPPSTHPTTAAPPVTAVAPPPAPAPVEPVTPTKALPTPRQTTPSASPEHPPASSSAKKGNLFAVQLASFPEKATAESTASRLKKAEGALLGATPLRIVEADLGARGLYYRVQTAPLTENDARALCASLKAHGKVCLIVKP